MLFVLVLSSQDRAQYLHQFVLHSSLDAVDDMIWATQGMFLNVVDKFNAMQVRPGGWHTRPTMGSNNTTSGSNTGLVMHTGFCICHGSTCQVSAAA